jgi:hypothetical protein
MSQSHDLTSPNRGMSGLARYADIRDHNTAKRAIGWSGWTYYRPLYRHGGLNRIADSEAREAFEYDQTEAKHIARWIAAWEARNRV